MKSKIEVRKYNEGGFEVIETISRKPWCESIGNFNPMFCRYKGKRTLVHSDEGDLSDPFRREDGYLKCLFIKV